MPKTKPNHKRKRDSGSIIPVPNNIEEFPHEILHHVASFLELKDLFQLARVSKKIGQISWSTQENRYLQICREYNLLFLMAIKEFIKSLQESKKFIISLDEETLATCQYGDENYGKLIEKATNLNRDADWIFHKEFLEQEEAKFFSEKDIRIYDELFIFLKHSVKIFIVEGQSLYSEDRQQFLQKLKNLIKEVAQLLVRWQCYRFRNNDLRMQGDEFEYAIHDVYELIEQVNKYIEKIVLNLDHWDEKSRKQHLICLELQLSNFSKQDGAAYGGTITSLDVWTGDFNYTDLSGSVGLENYLSNPIARETCYFAKLANCKSEKIDTLLCTRVIGIDEEDYATDAQGAPFRDKVVNFINSPYDFLYESKKMYKKGQESLLPKIKQLEEQVRMLQQHNVSLENKLKEFQSEETAPEDTSVLGLK